jgi:hypothetical protein
MKSVCWRDISTSMFIVALFTIVKKWKQTKCALTDEWMKKWDTYTQCNVIYLWKEWNPRQHRWNCRMLWNVEMLWNKPMTERQVPHDFTHMWSLNILNETSFYIHTTFSLFIHLFMGTEADSTTLYYESCHENHGYSGISIVCWLWLFQVFTQE